MCTSLAIVNNTFNIMYVINKKVAVHVCVFLSVQEPTRWNGSGYFEESTRTTSYVTCEYIISYQTYIHTCTYVKPGTSIHHQVVVELKIACL